MITKPKLFLIVFVLALLLGTRGSFASDLQSGFLGIPWGTDISDVTDLKLLYEKDTVRFYANPDVVPTIYELKVPDVVYGFHSGRFFACYVNIEAIEVFSRIKRYVQEKYGDPEITTMTKSKQSIYKWQHHNVRIKLKQRQTDNRMKLAFYYLPIAKELNEMRLEAYDEKQVRIFPIEKGKVPDNIPLLRF